MTVLLGTVALEPNRWGTVDRSRRATIDLAAWLRPIADAGFDGIELWEPHLDDQVANEAIVPVVVFNTYVSFDDEDSAGREAVAGQVARTSSRGVKFNVGNEPDLEPVYAERIAAWLDHLGPDVAVLCECHEGISIAADPAVAARLLAAAGPPARVQAIVHTHESDDHLRARFDAYGDRIGHVHVNFLDPSTGHVPRLREAVDLLARKVALLSSLGYRGSWTIEFVHGLLSADDHPAALLAQATDDLTVLREVLGCQS